MRVFVAGAGGVIGRRLVPQLVGRGHEVIATTRRPEREGALRALGARPLVMDGLDAASVGKALARTGPEVVVHQMTSLAGVTDLKHFDDAFAATNALRTRGTDHLLAAADAVGVRRFVAQSFTGWPNRRDGGPVKSEADGLDPHPPAAQAKSLDAIRHLERAVLGARLEGVVLRYGALYGPAASDAFVDLVRRRRLPLVGGGGGVWSWVHVDDAAAATVAAVEGDALGLHNVVDDEPAAVSEWLPHLCRCVGAPPPRRVPAWLARPMVGGAGVSIMTRIRGASNARARRELPWAPRWTSWRDGFPNALVDRADAVGAAAGSRSAG